MDTRFGAILTILLYTLVIKGTFGQGRQCPNSWLQYSSTSSQNTCVWTSYEKASWINAMSWCKLLGGHLVEIGSTLFNSFLMNLISGKQTGKYWIGLADIESEMSYQWVTSKRPVIVSHFYPGQQVSDRSKNCVALDEKGLWTVESCNAEFTFICQRDM